MQRKQPFHEFVAKSIGVPVLYPGDGAAVLIDADIMKGFAKIGFARRLLANDINAGRTRRQQDPVQPALGENRVGDPDSRARADRRLTAGGLRLAKIFLAPNEGDETDKISRHRFEDHRNACEQADQQDQSKIKGDSK